MRSQWRFWSLLSLMLAPLLLQATMGCQVLFPLKEPESHNKLRCDCSCEGGGSRQSPIVTSADDAEETATSVVLDNNALDLGQQIVGLRFADVRLPRRVKILTAYVQFTSGAGNSISTTLLISAEASIAAAPFTATAGDISMGRAMTAEIPWSPDPWGNGDGAGMAQRTEDLSTILQALVELPDWSDESPVVLKIKGTGRRTARSFEGGGAPVLVVTYDATIAATLPVCALPDAPRESNGTLTPSAMQAECARVEDTVEGLAGACGYPEVCNCTVNDVPDHSDSGQTDVCSGPCPEVEVDAACSNFDPNEFADCLEDSGTVASCEHFVAATNTPGDSPVCVDSGSPLAFHLFGRRSQCDVEGTSEIQVGDREPKHDPATAGMIEILGGPCSGGGCSVAPYFDLHMAPITFAVKFHSDPTFGDLKASGRAAEAVPVDAAGAIFLANEVSGTGSGRRGGASPGLAISAANEAPLDLGIDWDGHACALSGNLATAVDGETPDGLCDGDGTTVCTADSPDCDGVGGPCVFPASDAQQMTIDVTLVGTLVNQPPTAVAGPDQTVECTSAAGASFQLDGRGSSDPDQDLALARWRRGGRRGTEIGTDLVTTDAGGVGITTTYALLVLDGHAQTDLAETTVAVVDTTPPTVVCNAPATIAPPDHSVSFRATATDVCTSGAIIPTILGYECFRFNGVGRRIDKTNACKVTIAGDTITIRPPQGIGTHIAWTASAADASGNVGSVDCEVVVVNPSR